MDTIFINSENGKTSSLYRLLLNPSDKINVKNNDKYIALSNLSIYYKQKNIETLYKINNFKISAQTRNYRFQYPHGSHSLSYVKFILRKVTDNPAVRKYLNKVEYTFKIKRWYYLKLLIPEMMKLLGSTKSKITNDKNGKNVPHLEVPEVR